MLEMPDGIVALELETAVDFCHVLHEGGLRTKKVAGSVGELAPHIAVIRLVKGLGFDVTPAPEEGTMRLRLPLN